MPTPTPELQWVSIISSLVALFGVLVNFLIMWRNRRRIEFRTISSAIYYRKWNDYDLTVGDPRDHRPMIKPGDTRTAFIVVEFAIKNDYPIDVVVGRFVVNNWMFADHYTRGDSKIKRDYRVFDLYNRQPANLESFAKIEPKGSYGLRIEALEETSGPRLEGRGARYVLQLPREYIIQFHLDGKKNRRKIKLPRPELTADYAFRDVHRWSELLGKESWTASGAPIPQGIKTEDIWPNTWRDRFWSVRNWIDIQIYSAKLRIRKK